MRLKPLFSIAVLSFILITQFQNCANYHQQADFTPSVNSDASNDPNNVGSYLRAPAMSIIVDPSPNNILSFGGACGTGDALNNYIEFQVRTTDSNMPIPLKGDSACNASQSNDCLTYKNTKCEHGIYYAHILVRDDTPATSQFGTPFNLRAQLVMVDKSGKEIRDAQYSFQIPITIF